ncbi:hypothetical protein C8R47DRAFT_1196919 [Mycena vitilis]|nr:hypothetical protein C8R47DRAFT_1196919 [Mycena vitilis]
MALWPGFGLEYIGAGPKAMPGQGFGLALAVPLPFGGSATPPHERRGNSRGTSEKRSRRKAHINDPSGIEPVPAGYQRDVGMEANAGVMALSWPKGARVEFCRSHRVYSIWVRRPRRSESEQKKKGEETRRIQPIRNRTGALSYSARQRYGWFLKVERGGGGVLSIHAAKCVLFVRLEPPYAFEFEFGVEGVGIRGGSAEQTLSRGLNISQLSLTRPGKINVFFNVHDNDPSGIEPVPAGYKHREVRMESNAGAYRRCARRGTSLAEIKRFCFHIQIPDPRFQPLFRSKEIGLTSRISPKNSAQRVRSLSINPKATRLPYNSAQKKKKKQRVEPPQDSIPDRTGPAQTRVHANATNLDIQ